MRRRQLSMAAMDQILAALGDTAVLDRTAEGHLSRIIFAGQAAQAALRQLAVNLGRPFGSLTFSPALCYRLRSKEQTLTRILGLQLGTRKWAQFCTIFIEHTGETSAIGLIQDPCQAKILCTSNHR